MTASSKKKERVNFHPAKSVVDGRVFDVHDVGITVYSDQYGKWRTVPGFNHDDVLVSSEGWVRIRHAHKLRPPQRGSKIQLGYMKVTINKNPYRVHRLVCRAFHGPCPVGRDCDHIAKYNGDWAKERSDNRACNLRWATRKQQNGNQRKRKTQRTSKPIFIRRVNASESEQWIRFDNASQAADYIGLKSGRHLCAVANGDYGHKSIEGWVAKWDNPPETQEDLEGEVWVYVNERVKVSNMGRAQTRSPASKTKWSYKFTPTATSGEDYAHVCRQPFHVMVFKAFGGVLNEGETVDHIDTDNTNNNLSNLRSASAALQRANQSRRDGQLNSAQGDGVWGKKVASSEDEWEYFASRIEAERSINARGNKKIYNSNIGKVANGLMKQTAGWMFKVA